MDSFETLPYDEFVVVAEEEWKIHCNKNNAETKFSTRIGNYKWHCFVSHNKTIYLQCQEINEGTLEKVHIEVLLYYLYDSKYYRIKTNSERALLKIFVGLTVPQIEWKYSSTYAHHQSILLTIRILKDRSEFSLFTVPNSVANFPSDVKLRFGEQIYHVNKQLLSLFSPVFDRMFNGEFKESHQEEIELKVEGLANPNVFEDFLLVFCSCFPGQIEVMPNSQNVADLLELVQFFQVDLLKKKCERHLELCREMDIVERVLLAKKFGLKELQAKLVNSATPEESRRIIRALLDAPEQ